MVPVSHIKEGVGHVLGVAKRFTRNWFWRSSNISSALGGRSFQVSLLLRRYGITAVSHISIPVTIPPVTRALQYSITALISIRNVVTFLYLLVMVAITESPSPFDEK